MVLSGGQLLALIFCYCSSSISSIIGFLRLKWEDILDIQIEGEELHES